MASELIPAERRRQIAEVVRSRQAVKGSTLSEFFEVSEITIRRDLEHPEREGLLERTHGGAIYGHRMRLEPLYTEKCQIHQEEKRQIGAAATALVKDGEAPLINSGSTTLQIFRHLAGRKNLRVISSSMGAILEIQGLELELILIGGSSGSSPIRWSVRWPCSAYSKSMAASASLA